MNIETIGQNLAQLHDRIKDEKGIGETAKIELLNSLDDLEHGILATFDSAKSSVSQAIASFRKAIPMHFDERNDALDAMISEPVPQEDKQAA